MKNRALALGLSGLLFAGWAAPATAQFGGLVGKKSAAPAVDVDKALSAGSDLIGYITTANDLGMQGAGLMLAMYPDDRFPEIRKMSAQYNELSAKRKDGNLDAEQLKLSQSASAAIAEELKGDAWKGYKKENSANVGKAYGKLGLMVVADTLAGTLVKPTTDNLTAALEAVKKDPMKATQAGAIKSQLESLAAIAPALPKQIESAGTVRSICAKIAEAEKVKLPTDISADKIKDKATLVAAATELPE